MNLSFLKFLILLTLTFKCTAALSQDEYPPFEELTEIDNPFEMRDPFMQPDIDDQDDLKALESSELTETEKDRIALKNLNDLSKIKVVGIITGLKRNRALIEVEGRNLILSEGMEVGKKGGKIIAIREKGLVYTEFQKNIYRKEEVIEKVLKVVKPGEQEFTSKIRDMEADEKERMNKVNPKDL
jgi:Tfp pilus assembly protein PilP